MHIVTQLHFINFLYIITVYWPSTSYFSIYFFIYLASPWKNVHNTSTSYIHETEQEAGTPQQFTPIIVGLLVKISDKLQTKKIWLKKIIFLNVC
jgi:hypothetical protein